MAHIISEMSAFSTNCTLSHDCTSLDYGFVISVFDTKSQHAYYIRAFSKKQRFFASFFQKI